MKLIRRRWGWFLAALLLLAGLARLRVEPEALSLLPDSVPAVRGLRLYQKHFADSRELIATLRAPEAEAAETAARLLAEALRRETNLVAGVVWQPPWREHPEQMAEFLAYLWLNQPPEGVAQLTQRLALERLEGVAREARDRLATSLSPLDIARLSYDPFELSRLPETPGSEVSFASPQEGFTSADGRFRAVFVEARDRLSDYRDCARWLGAVRAVAEGAARLPAWPGGVVVRYTGSPAFVAEIASSMAKDFRLTVLGTLAVIAGLFWWAHRSWRPLGWLVAMLLLIMLGALAACGFLFGTLNAVSLGFGAILAGLAVDYGLVVHAEATARPDRTPSEVRRSLLPSLTWSALTTATAFLSLNLLGLPGLSQLGTLVGVGVLLTPPVMLFLFLPLVGPAPRSRAHAAHVAPAASGPGGHCARCRVATLGAVGLALIVLWRTGIHVDHGNRPLEPRDLPASLALREFDRELAAQSDPLLCLVSGRDKAEVARRLEGVERHLAAARANGVKFSQRLPNAVWPRPEWQSTNRAAVAALSDRASALRAAAEGAGFTAEAMEFTDRLLRFWREGTEVPGGQWPTNESCRWLLRRAAAWTGTHWLAVGAVFPEAGTGSELAARLDPRLPGVWLTGWSLLGESLAAHLERRLLGLGLAIALIVTLCLWLAFRRAVEVVISLGALGFTLLVVQAVMSAAGIAWNLMSLAAVPLLLGAGVDYSIHVQMALRRHGGDLTAVRRITGRALLLCAASTVAGFGSNVLSSNPGLASLGSACAIGITTAYITAVFLAPAWWTLLRPRGQAASEATDRLARPSATYGPGLWRLGRAAVQWLPRSLCDALGQTGAAAYRWFRPERLRVIEANLLPVVGGDRLAARLAARRLLAHFAAKIIALLRHEGGAAAGIALSRWSGYERFQAALDRRQGVLLLTPHLGNWEVGGCVLAQKGVRLLVLTQAEPGRGFTELRQQARARWGIETLVVGQDAFAFVEVIKRLQAGAVVALLVDRPPPPTAVTVELFGRPFQASIAPAELARASGCALVPVYVVAEGDAYAAHVLPEITYDRRAIGDREARRRLAGEIVGVFEPAIRQYADQWYHFVPLWNEGATQPTCPKTE